MASALALGAAVSAGPAAADVGDLTQKADAAGCILGSGAEGCNTGPGIGWAFSVAVSPDGTSAYLASREIGGTLTVFNRDPATGGLTQKPGTGGCFRAGAADASCAHADGLTQARSVTVSPDSKNVYVASGGYAGAGGAVASFDRDTATGALTQKPVTAGCIQAAAADSTCAHGDGLDGANSVTISPDGKNAYVASFASSAVAVFDRNTATGALTQKPSPAGCISDDGSGSACVDGKALSGAFSVAVSPDGTNAYVASLFSGAVSIFDRNTTTGALTQKPSPAGCVSEDGSGGDCVNGEGLADLSGVVVSPDGKNVYTIGGLLQGGGRLASFDRDSTTGALTEKAATVALVGLSAAVSPDGRNLYVASGASGLRILDRDPATGVVVQKPLPRGCIHAVKFLGGCTLGRGVDGLAGVVASPDGKNVYTAASAPDFGQDGVITGVAIFDRELGPPDTTITGGPAQGAATTDTTPTFGFGSDQSAATFRCTIDGGAAFACTSPFTTASLSVGTHTFSVAAVAPGRWFDPDATKATDATPAVRTFTVELPAPASGVGVVIQPAQAADKTAPTAKIGTITCKLRKCTIKVGASDVGGTVASLSVQLTYKVKSCRRVQGRQRCKTVTKTKRLSPKQAVGGFTAKTGRLKRGRYTATAVATDNSGNRSKAAGKTFRVS